MNMLCRFFHFSIAIVLTSLITTSAQNLPNTTRLLRFPTTNDRDIVFCYAGQLYTVGKDGVDNGGNVDVANVYDAGADIGIRLWDPAKRRQPPVPAVPPNSNPE